MGEDGERWRKDGRSVCESGKGREGEGEEKRILTPRSEGCEVRDRVAGQRGGSGSTLGPLVHLHSLSCLNLTVSTP